MEHMWGIILGIVVAELYHRSKGAGAPGAG